MRPRSPRSIVPALLVWALLPSLHVRAGQESFPRGDGTSGEIGSSVTRVFRLRDGTPIPLQGPDAICAFLSEAEVVRVEDLASGITRPRRITLTRDGLTLRAIFKAVDINHDGIQTRDGEAYAEFFDRAISEVAAYRLARLLGIDMIPPTVERDLLGERGALQLWIEGAMTEAERNRRGNQPPEARPWRRQHQIMRVFDALVHNSDRNTGNRLIDGEWQLWMIDHTRTFQRPRGSYDFDRVQQMPGALWTALRSLDEARIREALSPYIEPLQMASLLDRHRALVAHVDRLITERGEAAVIVD